MVDDHEQRERRVTDSAKLHGLIADLSRVPLPRRMYVVHDELMHAINQTLAKHDGHRFAEAEINVIKDVAFEIVYILDPKNRPATGFFRKGYEEFKALSVFGKIGAIVAVLLFIGGMASGTLEFAKRSYELWKVIKSEAPVVGPVLLQQKDQPQTTPSSAPQQQSPPPPSRTK
jgi:hypothetical protein